MKNFVSFDVNSIFYCIFAKIKYQFLYENCFLQNATRLDTAPALERMAGEWNKSSFLFIINKLITIAMRNFYLLYFTLLFIGLTACKNAMGDFVWKISPDSKSQIIEKEINGITFKFCLLNEQGQPATVFNEGENFSFYFSVTNRTNKKLFFLPDFAYTNENEFCEVFTSNNQSIGRPFIFGGYEKIGIGAYPFNPDTSCVFEQQWIDKRDSTWRWKYGYYESNYQTPLLKGSYFTGFQSRFQFYDTYLDTTLTFKINFKIQ
jgi:hypothetical protein